MSYILILIIGIIVGIIITLLRLSKLMIGDLQCVILEGEPQYVVIFNDQESKEKVPKLPYVLLNVKKSQK